MTDDASKQLFEAFREDHAILGRGFHDIATCLRGGDLRGARAVAQRMDTEAGAHIVFEEEHFYPALARFLDAGEIENMYAEHETGRAVLNALLAIRGDSDASDASRQQLLEQAEIMQRHIAECGALFGAMGGLTPHEQAALYRSLTQLRDQAPRWTRYVGRRTAGKAPG